MLQIKIWTMKRKNYKHGYQRPVFCLLSILLMLFFADARTVYAQDPGRSCPGGDLQVREHNSADLTTLQSVRRHVAAHLTYPESSVKAGHSGLVELYARVGHRGVINEIHKHRPDGNYMEVDEIVIFADPPAGIEITESSRHEELVCEARRVIRLLPSLDMPEVFGGLLKFSFRFVLQSDN
jgi:hypothetical protein